MLIDAKGDPKPFKEWPLRSASAGSEAMNLATGVGGVFLPGGLF